MEQLQFNFNQEESEKEASIYEQETLFFVNLISTIKKLRDIEFTTKTSAAFTVEKYNLYKILSEDFVSLFDRFDFSKFFNGDLSKVPSKQLIQSSDFSVEGTLLEIIFDNLSFIKKDNKLNIHFGIFESFEYMYDSFVSLDINFIESEIKNLVGEKFFNENYQNKLIFNELNNLNHPYGGEGIGEVSPEYFKRMMCEKEIENLSIKDLRSYSSSYSSFFRNPEPSEEDYINLLRLKVDLKNNFNNVQHKLNSINTVLDLSEKIKEKQDVISDENLSKEDRAFHRAQLNEVEKEVIAKVNPILLQNKAKVLEELVKDESIDGKFKDMLERALGKNQRKHVLGQQSIDVKNENNILNEKYNKLDNLETKISEIYAELINLKNSL
jgi:hypothetical protein